MPPDAASPPSVRRAAVVANPTKHDVTKLRHAVRAAMTEHGWDEPLWFETTPADPAATG